MQEYEGKTEDCQSELGAWARCLGVAGAATPVDPLCVANFTCCDAGQVLSDGEICFGAPVALSVL